MSLSIETLLNPTVYNHPVGKIKLLETHISWIVLTGEFAYKIKKPVNYGFLDFSTLQKRQHYCAEEVRLNRRMAKQLYLDVVAIGGSAQQPVIKNKNAGDAFEYAVKMRQFPQSAKLDERLNAGKLTQQHMHAIAQRVADFHSTVDVATSATVYGKPTTVYHPIAENFTLIHGNLPDRTLMPALQAIQHWSEEEFKRLQATIRQRKQQGFVRECHGDLHLRNMLWFKGEPLAFDCIEFNPELRWIDVISDIAFLVMDLQDRQAAELASYFLNSYLEFTGDYAGLKLLPFYACYRAMVRAKVNALRLQQADISVTEKQQAIQELTSYINLAKQIIKPTPVKLSIMRGVSASGKSTISGQMIAAPRTIRIRSDVERKRLFNKSRQENISSGIHSGYYSPEASAQTYQKLLQLAQQILQAGYSVIVDAAFLKVEQRQPFQQLAQQLKLPYEIIEVRAPEALLRQRIINRENDVSDADLKVLEHQLANWQALQENEKKFVTRINTAT